MYFAYARQDRLEAHVLRLTLDNRDLYPLACPFTAAAVGSLTDYHERVFSYRREFCMGADLGPYTYSDIMVYRYCGHEGFGVLLQDAPALVFDRFVNALRAAPADSGTGQSTKVKKNEGGAGMD